MTDGSIGFIDDSYNLDGFVAGSNVSSSGMKFWDDLNFKYRVATPTEVRICDAQVAKAKRVAFDDPKKEADAIKAECEFVCSHLLEWDMKNRGGHDMERTAANLARVHQSLFERLYLIIRGDMMSDPKPDATEQQPTHAEQAKN